MGNKNQKKTSTGKREYFKGKPGPGRPKGLKNKVCSQMVDDALLVYNDMGGKKWLRQLVESDSPAEQKLGHAIMLRLMPQKTEQSIQVEGKLTWAGVIAGKSGLSADS